LSVFRLPDTPCEALNGLAEVLAIEFKGDVTADCEAAKGDVLAEALGVPETGKLPTVEFTDCWALPDSAPETLAEAFQGDATRFPLEPNSPAPL